MRFYSESHISDNLSLTPEGFLICRNVPIARTGTQVYFAGEVPVTPDQNGAITITREPEEVFNADAIASFEGKPITVTHPEGFVTPDNWRELAVGTVHGVHQGSGIENDVLLGDLLITEKDAIKAVMNRDYREVSCGYDAEYVEMGAGQGKQTQIRGNHVALVEKGRCGALCAIHDSQGGDMKKGKWYEKFLPTLPENVRSLFKDAAEEAEEKKEKKEEEEEEKGKKSMDARLSKIEDAVNGLLEEKKAKDARDAEAEEKKKKEEEEKEKESKDWGPGCKEGSKDAAPAFQEILYRSSILAPGLKRPTADSIATMDAEAFKKASCSVKRLSLDAAYKTEEGKKAIDPFLNGKMVNFMDCDCSTVDLAFVGASEVMKQSGANRRINVNVKDFGGTVKVADINKQNREFWASRNGGR